MPITKQEIDELEKYKEEMALKRRIRQQALAVLKRAKDADIPDSEMRINEQQFCSLMDMDYFRIHDKSEKDVVNMCHELFTIPNKLLRTPFILIDGGDMYSRKRAGYALLFRMIAWDRNGMHYNCSKITHNLQAWDYNSGLSRNEFSETLKGYDVLFISECIGTLFKPALEAGSFLDEILEARESNGKPTILSFQQPIPAQQIESVARYSEAHTGQYMMMFSESESEDVNHGNMLRIRVK